MTELQKQLSDKLKALFPEYLNSLRLKDEYGKELVLDKDGNGSFKEFIKGKVIESAQIALKRGFDLSKIDWLIIADGEIKDVDFSKYIEFRGRMKETPAFDNINLGTPENELFGSETEKCRHFTEFSNIYSAVKGEMAEESQVKLMNPMNYIDDNKSDKAKYYRIRHGAIDCDTSLAISAMLALKLENNGIDVDFQYPWGIPHSGDYDLEDLFNWIDRICK